MFAPDFGIVEDEATGAAAVRITVSLGRDLLIHQGAGSLITTRLLDGDRVEIGGRTVFDRTIILED
jgi:predicted PhzF superfamily epimerase YddE/YHI9